MGGGGGVEAEGKNEISDRDDDRVKWTLPGGGEERRRERNPVGGAPKRINEWLLSKHSPRWPPHNTRRVLTLAVSYANKARGKSFTLSACV